MIQILQPSRPRPALLVVALAALALIALLAAAALWSSAASAQTPDDDEPSGGAASEQTPEDETITTLQRTQIAAEIPEQYNELFQLQWGGGSLYQFKQRLATMNCIVDTVWVYQNNQWHGYNQYQVPSTLNTQFIETYSEFIPAGTLYASCYRICEFIKTRPQNEWRWRTVDNKYLPQECLSFEHSRAKNFYIGIYPVDETTPCNDDFDQRVKDRVFPALPLIPDVCIARQKGGAYGINGLASFETINTAPAIIIYDGRNVYRNPTERNTIALKMEIHELCHINQGWQWVQGMSMDTTEIVYSPYYSFEDSPQGQEFINLLGFTRTGTGRINPRWRLPSDSVYQNIYSSNPVELSAELCAMYFLDKMGERSGYDYETYNNGRLQEVPIRNIDVNIYLTPEIRQWIETYIVLPN